MKKVPLILIALTLILLLTFSPVSAAKPAPGLPGGVGAGPLFHWRFQAGTTASNTSYWLEAEWIEAVKIMSAGRLYIDLLPVGSLVTSFETLDATMTGAIEIATS